MFYLRLKEERKKLNYKQNELAEILEVSRQRMLRYENGESNPTPLFFEKLFHLGFDIQYIITGVRVENFQSPVNSEGKK